MADRFTKMHGLGNDFVVIDARASAVEMTPARAHAIADRRHGIGCDQLILLEPSSKADVRMRIFNADGGEVEGGARHPSSLPGRETTDAATRARFHLMPTCGTQYYRLRDDGVETVYAHALTEDEKSRALTAVEDEARRLGLWEAQTWGDILEDRGSQITFSALGQTAPLEAKVAWDPTGEKKNALRDAVAARIPDLEVRSGGSTSVDITHRGIDKAYGMRQLADVTGIPLDDMLFVGDRLDEHGNDYPVLAMGVACQAVDGWEDTAAFLTDLIPTLPTR